MDRISIPDGEIITLSNKSGSRSYKIEKVIGKGAHCIAYAAHTMDLTSRRVRIKECYPIDEKVSRDGLCLVWSDSSQKDCALKTFRDTFERQVLIQNNDAFVNSFTHIVDDISEGNETLYTIVDIDNGVTFDEDPTRNLEEILKTVAALAKVIGFYHGQGYLHLDIKPENFLVIPETRDLIKLLDADSITQKVLVSSGEISVIPYSCGWAAPEQIQGKVRKISERSDIYSIGAVLFEKIMGRCPNNDDIGVYADYDIPSQLIQRYDPRIEGVLKRIFRNTLAASVNRRYSSVSALITIIEEAIRICSNDRYILSKESISDVFFVGRKNELKELHKKLKEEVKVVFLHGFGGIGKTELAKRYVKEYKDDYDVTVFSMYSEDKGLQQYINDIVINGYKEPEDDISTEEKTNKKLKELSTLCTPKTLFIIDNFDIDDDSFLDRLISLDAKFLITSRNDHSEMISDETIQYELATMDIEELIPLFIHELGRQITDKEDEYARKIINRFDNYTIMVPLIAKQIKASDSSLEEFWRKLNEDGLAIFGDETESVKHRKDGAITQASLFGHISHLFKVSDLDDKHKCVLANMRDLCEHYRLTKSVYREYTHTNNLSILNDLIDRGWIETQYIYSYYDESDIMCLQLHPVIADLVDEFLNTQEYHQDLLRFVKEKLYELSQDPDDQDIRSQIGNVMAVYACIIDVIDYDGADEVLQFLYGFYRHEYQNANLNMGALLYSAPDFRIIASDEYFSSNIFDRIDLLYENDVHKNEQQKLLDKFDNMCMRFSFKLYRDCINFSMSDTQVNAERVRESYWCLNKWIKDLIKLLSFITDAKVEVLDDSFSGDMNDNSDETVFRIFELAISLKNALTAYMQIYPIQDEHWVVNGKETALFGDIVHFPESAELYFNVAEMAFILSQYFENENDSAADDNYDLYRRIILLLEYYQGSFKDPYSFKPQPIGYYREKWDTLIKSFSNIPFELPFKDGTEKESEESFSAGLLINADKNRWRKQLGASITDLFQKSSLSYQTYEMLVDFEFIINQPATVRKALCKNNLARKVMNDDELTIKQKQHILIHLPFTGICKAIDLWKERKYRSISTFVNRFSVVFDLYISCLEYLQPQYTNEAGTKLSKNRCEYYYALFKVYKLKGIKKESLVTDFMKEVVMDNTSFILDLIELSILVYQNGFHKKSKEIQKSIADLWKENIKDKATGTKTGIEYSYAMIDLGKRLKDIELQQNAQNKYSSYTIEEKQEYIISGDSYPKYQSSIIRDIYWDILHFAAEILEKSGMKGLEDSDTFKEYYNLAKELNKYTEEEKLGNFRGWMFVDNLWSMVNGLSPAPHYPNYNSYYNYRDHYVKQKRYSQTEEGDKYTGWGYVLLAENVLNKDYARFLFRDEEIVGSQIKRVDYEAYKKGISYFDIEEE